MSREDGFSLPARFILVCCALWIAFAAATVADSMREIQGLLDESVHGVQPQPRSSSERLLDASMVQP